MPEFSYIHPAGVAPATGYSHVVSASGRWVAISGQVALDADGQLVGADDVTAQTRQVFTNLNLCLASAGASFADVVKFTVYVTDIAVMPSVRAVRAEYIDDSRPPASTVLQVAALAHPGFLIEVEAYAAI